jgi:hypothetical protein
VVGGYSLFLGGFNYENSGTGTEFSKKTYMAVFTS